MTPYNIYYFTYNRCLKHFFFSQEKETLHQRKSACSLRSPAAPRGARTPLICLLYTSWMMTLKVLLRTLDISTYLQLSEDVIRKIRRKSLQLLIK